jgi:uncharacterized protein DUF4411
VSRHWLDSSVFITARDTMFAFDINASFWAWMTTALESGIVVAPKKVYMEIVENVRMTDDLAIWVKTRRKKGLCVEPDEKTLQALKSVTNYLFQPGGRYEYPFALDFVRGADPWIIAHAMADGGTVVSQETDKQPLAKRVRIPDVCDKFGVPCVKVWDMLRNLNVKL